MIEGVSFNKHKSVQEHLMKDSIIWTIAGGWKSKFINHMVLILIGRNQ